MPRDDITPSTRRQAGKPGPFGTLLAEIDELMCRYPRDLLITNFDIQPYAIGSTVGQAPSLLAYSAWRALIEPDSEPNL